MATATYALLSAVEWGVHRFLGYDLHEVLASSGTIIALGLQTHILCCFLPKAIIAAAVALRGRKARRASPKCRCQHCVDNEGAASGPHEVN